MKKFSLILALVLCFTLVLVACNDTTEESSVAESTAESTAESKVESTVESEDESEEASEEESEEASEDESSEPAPEAGDDNLAAGKTYTYSELFRQGGADAGWGWDANAPITYPDEEDKSLTDGVFPADGAAYSDVEWVGFNSNHPEYAGYHHITLDLGESKDLAKFVIWYGTKALENGISSPATIEVYVSEDGANWGSAVGGNVPVNDETSVNESVVIEAGATGRYVQFRFTSGGWAFISEVEVYGAAE